MNSIKVVCLLVLIAGFGACKPRSKGSTITLDVNHPNFILTSALQQRNFNYDYLTFKAKTDFTSASGTNNFTANTRMKKGEIIWSSITALLGIEAARVYIEGDSVMLRDNLHRTAYVSNMNYLVQYTNTKLDVTQLQNLMVGNPVFTDSLYQIVEIQGDTMVRVKAHVGPISNELWIENKSFKIVRSELEDAISQQKLSVHYADFVVLNNANFPKNVSLSTKQDGFNVLINMDYQDVNLDVIDQFPFSIPDKWDIKTGE